MSSNEIKKRNKLSDDEQTAWSETSRKQWVSSAIAAATASLRASAPTAGSGPAIQLDQTSD